jgi:hypothetical protein
MILLDSMQYTGTPAGWTSNVARIPGVYQQHFTWEGDVAPAGAMSAATLPTQASVISRMGNWANLYPANAASHDYAFVDIEGNWYSELGGTNETSNGYAMDKYTQVYDWAKAALQYPSAKLSMWDLFPTGWGDWYHIFEQNGFTLANWEATQARVAPMATLCDVLMPGLYAWENDIAKWRDYVDAKLAMISQYAPNKEIYPFLWSRVQDFAAAVSFTATGNGTAQTVQAYSSTNIYVAGTFSATWVVEKSPNGSDWTTVATGTTAANFFVSNDTGSAYQFRMRCSAYVSGTMVTVIYTMLTNPFVAQQLAYLEDKVDGVVFWDGPGAFTYADPWLAAGRDFYFPGRVAYR